MQTLRTLALALAVGLVAGTGFWTVQAVADQFTDVPAGNAFAGDIDWLTDQDIAAGFPDGTFDPTAPVKRQQAARWLRRYNARMQLAVASVDPAADDHFSATVDCPQGLRAVAGSGSADAGMGLTVTAGYPSETYQWQVDWEGDQVVDPTHLEVVAFCIPTPTSS